MSVISGSVRLRPTRIGFLVPPTDLQAVRRVMRASICLWGGMFNPIIPVSRATPEIWRPEKHRRQMSGLEVAKGYVRFFEPDVFVETRPGLAKSIGLTEAQHALKPEVISFETLLNPKDRQGFGLGLSVVEILQDQYRAEQQFVQRNPIPAMVLKPSVNDAGAEAVIGRYPTDKALAGFDFLYRSAFEPEEVDWNPDTWLRLYRDGAHSPRTVANYQLKYRQYWYHEPIVFVFDPLSSLDLIDLWNLRLEPSRVFPVPVDWVDAIAPFVQELAKRHHRPINDNGVMSHMTIEFGRSIQADHVEDLTGRLRGDATGLLLKTWRTPIWEPPPERMARGPERLQITAQEADARLRNTGYSPASFEFEPLRPTFADSFGGVTARWVNVLQVKQYGEDGLGLFMPFNAFDRSWPRLSVVGEPTLITSEGWVFRHSLTTQSSLRLLTSAEAVHQSLARRGVKAELSEPGRVAYQMAQRIGGLWRAELLRDRDTLKLLNNMAGSVRRRSSDKDYVQEEFAGRTASTGQWRRLAKQRDKNSLRSNNGIEPFTAAGVIRLGLQSTCPHCGYSNWSGLDTVDYDLRCERCLNGYPYPQAELPADNGAFRYRVAGPFAVPDFGQGSYSSLLTLAALKGLYGSSVGMSYATASQLTFEGKSLEADFVALVENERGVDVRSPDLVIGECKSFGKGDLVKDDDLAKLKAICAHLPGALAVIAVMRDDFTKTEVDRLKRFVGWARRPDENDRPTNSVILLTGRELFAEFRLDADWPKFGPPWSEQDGYHATEDLRALAETTQRIYLGLPSFWEWPAKRRPRGLKG